MTTVSQKVFPLNRLYSFPYNFYLAFFFRFAPVPSSVFLRCRLPVVSSICTIVVSTTRKKLISKQTLKSRTSLLSRLSKITNLSILVHRSQLVTKYLTIAAAATLMLESGMPFPNAFIAAVSVCENAWRVWATRTAEVSMALSINRRNSWFSRARKVPGCAKQTLLATCHDNLELFQPLFCSADVGFDDFQLYPLAGWKSIHCCASLKAPFTWNKLVN